MSSQVVKHMSDQGNQCNNGPHQDQIFDIFPLLSAWQYGPKIRFCWGGVGGVGELMHPIGSL